MVITETMLIIMPFICYNLYSYNHTITITTHCAKFHINRIFGETNNNTNSNTPENNDTISCSRNTSSNSGSNDMNKEDNNNKDCINCDHSNGNGNNDNNRNNEDDADNDNNDNNNKNIATAMTATTAGSATGRTASAHGRRQTPSSKTMHADERRRERSLPPPRPPGIRFGRETIPSFGQRHHHDLRGTMKEGRTARGRKGREGQERRGKGGKSEAWREELWGR